MTIVTMLNLEISFFILFGSQDEGAVYMLAFVSPARRVEFVNFLGGNAVPVPVGDGRFLSRALDDQREIEWIIVWNISYERAFIRSFSATVGSFHCIFLCVDGNALVAEAAWPEPHRRKLYSTPNIQLVHFIDRLDAGVPKFVLWTPGVAFVDRNVQEHHECQRVLEYTHVPTFNVLVAAVIQIDVHAVSNIDLDPSERVVLNGLDRIVDGAPTFLSIPAEFVRWAGWSAYVGGHGAAMLVGSTALWCDGGSIAVYVRNRINHIGI